MSELLPSEIARLILGYLEENGYAESAKCMLNEVSDLKEVAKRRQSGKRASLRHGDSSLCDILEDYTDTKELIRESIKTYPAIFSTVGKIKCLKAQVADVVSLSVKINGRISQIQKKKLLSKKIDPKLCSPCAPVANSTPNIRVTHPDGITSNLSEQNGILFDLSATPPESLPGNSFSTPQLTKNACSENSTASGSVLSSCEVLDSMRLSCNGNETEKSKLSLTLDITPQKRKGCARKKSAISPNALSKEEKVESFIENLISNTALHESIAYKVNKTLGTLHTPENSLASDDININAKDSQPQKMSLDFLDVDFNSHVDVHDDLQSKSRLSNNALTHLSQEVSTDPTIEAFLRDIEQTFPTQNLSYSFTNNVEKFPNCSRTSPKNNQSTNVTDVQESAKLSIEEKSDSVPLTSEATTDIKELVTKHSLPFTDICISKESTESSSVSDEERTIGGDSPSVSLSDTFSKGIQDLEKTSIDNTSALDNSKSLVIEDQQSDISILNRKSSAESSSLIKLTGPSDDKFKSTSANSPSLANDNSSMGSFGFAPMNFSESSLSKDSFSPKPNQLVQIGSEHVPNTDFFSGTPEHGSNYTLTELADLNEQPIPDIPLDASIDKAATEYTNIPEPSLPVTFMCSIPKLISGSMPSSPWKPEKIKVIDCSADGKLSEGPVVRLDEEDCGQVIEVPIVPSNQTFTTVTVLQVECGSTFQNIAPKIVSKPILPIPNEPTFPKNPFKSVKGRGRGKRKKNPVEDTKKSRTRKSKVVAPKENLSATLKKSGLKYTLPNNIEVNVGKIASPGGVVLTKRCREKKPKASVVESSPEQKQTSLKLSPVKPISGKNLRKSVRKTRNINISPKENNKTKTKSKSKPAKHVETNLKSNESTNEDVFSPVFSEVNEDSILSSSSLPAMPDLSDITLIADSTIGIGAIMPTGKSPEGIELSDISCNLENLVDQIEKRGINELLQDVMINQINSNEKNSLLKKEQNKFLSNLSRRKRSASMCLSPAHVYRNKRGTQSTPRNKSTHIRTLDFNTPNKEAEMKISPRRAKSNLKFSTPSPIKRKPFSPLNCTLSSKVRKFVSEKTNLSSLMEDSKEENDTSLYNDKVDKSLECLADNNKTFNHVNSSESPNNSRSPSIRSENKNVKYDLKLSDESCPGDEHLENVPEIVDGSVIDESAPCLSYKTPIKESFPKFGSFEGVYLEPSTPLVDFNTTIPSVIKDDGMDLNTPILPIMPETSHIGTPILNYPHGPYSNSSEGTYYQPSERSVDYNKLSPYKDSGCNASLLDLVDEINMRNYNSDAQDESSPDMNGANESPDEIDAFEDEDSVIHNDLETSSMIDCVDDSSKSSRELGLQVEREMRKLFEGDPEVTSHGSSHKGESFQEERKRNSRSTENKLQESKKVDKFVHPKREAAIKKVGQSELKNPFQSLLSTKAVNNSLLELLNQATIMGCSQKPKGEMDHIANSAGITSKSVEPLKIIDNPDKNRSIEVSKLTKADIVLNKTIQNRAITDRRRNTPVKSAKRVVDDKSYKISKTSRTTKTPPKLASKPGSSHVPILKNTPIHKNTPIAGIPSGKTLTDSYKGKLRQNPKRKSLLRDQSIKSKTMKKFSRRIAEQNRSMMKKSKCESAASSEDSNSMNITLRELQVELVMGKKGKKGSKSPQNIVITHDDPIAHINETVVKHILSKKISPRKLKKVTDSDKMAIKFSQKSPVAFNNWGSGVSKANKLKNNKPISKRGDLTSVWREKFLDDSNSIADDLNLTDSCSSSPVNLKNIPQNGKVRMNSESPRTLETNVLKSRWVSESNSNHADFGFHQRTPQYSASEEIDRDSCARTIDYSNSPNFQSKPQLLDSSKQVLNITPKNRKKRSLAILEGERTPLYSPQRSTEKKTDHRKELVNDFSEHHSEINAADICTGNSLINKSNPNLDDYTFIENTLAALDGGVDGSKTQSNFISTSKDDRNVTVLFTPTGDHVGDNVESLSRRCSDDLRSQLKGDSKMSFVPMPGTPEKIVENICQNVVKGGAMIAFPAKSTFYQTIDRSSSVEKGPCKRIIFDDMVDSELRDEIKESDNNGDVDDLPMQDEIIVEDNSNDKNVSNGNSSLEDEATFSDESEGEDGYVCSLSQSETFELLSINIPPLKTVSSLTGMSSSDLIDQEIMGMEVNRECLDSQSSKYVNRIPKCGSDGEKENISKNSKKLVKKVSDILKKGGSLELSKSPEKGVHSKENESAFIMLNDESMCSLPPTPGKYLFDQSLLTSPLSKGNGIVFGLNNPIPVKPASRKDSGEFLIPESPLKKVIKKFVTQKSIHGSSLSVSKTKNIVKVKESSRTNLYSLKDDVNTVGESGRNVSIGGISNETSSINKLDNLYVENMGKNVKSKKRKNDDTSKVGPLLPFKKRCCSGNTVI